MGQTVVFSLQGSAAAETISFSVTDSFLSKDKTINDLVRVQEGSTTQITVDVGRRSDADAAAWYKEKVQGNTEHTMYTGWGSPFPDELNFALEGVITVGGRSYQVWFGQGSPSIFQNNWYFASHDFKARDDNQSGYLDNRYYIKPNGSYTFELELTGEVCIGKTINLTAFTNATGVQPRFDLEGDVPYEFSLEQAPLQGVAAMRTGQTFDTTGISPAHRDFRTQVTDADDVKMVFTENMHRLDRVKGCLHGKTVAEQTLQRYTVSGTKMIKSWGVSNVSQPVEDQAYIYTSEDKSDWMQELTKKYASVRMCDLVLPASHDAGMYEVNFDPKLPRFLDLTLILLGPLGFLVKVLLIRESNNLENVMYNLGVTQKDNAYDQLTSGTRMFDFRPAYMTDREHKGTYHIHDFIPGCRFDTFLQDISRFLAEHKGEVVVVIIQPNGINTKHFSFLTKEEVVEFADENIDSDVGYTFQDDEDFAEFQTKKVTDMLDKRVIFLYEPSETNDSYNSEDHTASLTDPSAVLGTLAKTVQNNRNEKLTVLQLQNTGQGALLNHVRDIGLHLASWAHNLVYCKTGNILQATKPIFDSATYTWLTAPETVGHVKQQRCLVALLNDFVDVAMAEHAIALCHARQAAAPMAP
eukprot:TRINITY_DN1281_c0_g1_i1.p1 TRINITY_DN1281_c0_g1~~TRINITY_DN1281_c0_g1_i1.p1  ORF type:complete len:638 (+),score=146.35 TRINITY_DN1281_c0_g1_i1:38-1951(+)